MPRWLPPLLLLLTWVMPVWAEDWPGWLGPRRDNYSTETVRPWTGALPILWKVEVGEGHSSPIVAGGKVFLHTKVAGDEREQVEAFEATTGKPLWKQSYPRDKFSSQFGNGPRGTPLLHEGLVYTLGATGLLTCWDAASGEQRWQKDLLRQFGGKNLFFGVSTTPLVWKDLVIVMVGAPGGSLVALDRKSGDVKWQAGEDAASYSSPILSSDGQLIALTAKGVRAFDPASGKPLWFQRFVDLLNESSSTPVQAGRKLVVSSVTAGMLCLDLDGLNATTTTRSPQVWREGKLSCYFATPVAVGEHLFVVTGSLPPAAQANLHCVELATGKVRWMKPKVGTYHATLLRTADRLLMLEEGGDLVLLEPDTKEYRELCRAKVCGTTWAHPALANGRLYIRDGKELLCVDLKR